MGLTPSSGGPPSRRSRAARLPARARGGTAGVIAVVGFILAAIDVMGFGIPFLAAIVAVVCLLLFRRTVGR